MHALYPADHADTSPTTRYYACGDRLDHALLKNDSKRIRRLRYAQDMLAEEVREALQEERERISRQVDEMLQSLFDAFKPQPR